MKILHVTDTYPPKQGGIEVQVHELARRQLEAGHQVRVVTRRTLTSAGGDQPTACGPGAGTVPVDVLAPTWTRPRRSRRDLRGVLSTFDPDVMHVHTSLVSPLAVQGAHEAHLQSRPCLVTLHSMIGGLAPEFPYRALRTPVGWHRWRVQWSAVSDLAARPVRDMLAPGRTVLTLPNGIDPARWHVTPAPRTAGRVLAVSVMRLQARKRPRALVSMLARARAALPADLDLHLVVAGDGPLREPLRHEIRRARLDDHVTLAGSLTHDQLRDLYTRADFYVAPAVLESFGIAALEARCAGLPVLALAGTGITDFVVDGTHGLIAADDDALVQAMVRISTDHALRAHLTDVNRTTTPTSDWKHHLHLCEQAYDLAAALARGTDPHPRSRP